jgi:hypothetical protein
MMAFHNLLVEYGHCTVEQAYENVLNSIVKVTNGLGDFWPSLISHQNYGGYWLVGWQEYKQLPLVELMCECTIVVATAVFYFCP